MKISWRQAPLALALAAACGSVAAQPADTPQSLRRELDALRADYEARIRALEQRLQAADALRPAAPAQAAAPAAPAAPPANAVAIAPPAAGGPVTGAPALSLILAGQYGRTKRDPASYRIRGFPLPPDAEIGPGTRGFSLAESELGFAASIDPWFRGQANLSFGADNSVSVEEAFVQTTSLGNGLSAKAGRFFSGIGYQNEQHAHAWDFADAPLAYQALLGTQFANDGLQLAWLAPTDRLIELRAELGRGQSFPGNDANRNGAGAAALSAHVGDDIGTSHSYRAGVSLLRTKAGGQALASTDPAGADLATSFSGSTRVWIADGVYKWAPEGNATRTNFKLQGEYLWATRSGSLVVDPSGTASDGGYRVAQSGWYLQGVYQFMPRWRVGLRTERLDPGTPDYGLNSALLGVDGGSARKTSLMLEHNPSEFSRIRLQLAQDRARPGASDWQWLLQYQMSLGAHGAHGY